MNRENTVFISYRNKPGRYAARLVYNELSKLGFDVFFDVESIPAGQFGKFIQNQIASRAHFLVVLVPGTLERTYQKGDWMTREISYAMKLGRNIIPLIFDDFDIQKEKQYLPNKIKGLFAYQAVYFYNQYFDGAIQKLCGEQFLRKPVNVNLAQISVPNLLISDYKIKKAVHEQQVVENIKLQLEYWYRNPSLRYEIEPNLLDFLQSHLEHVRILVELTNSIDWPYASYGNEFLEKCSATLVDSLRTASIGGDQKDAEERQDLIQHLQDPKREKINV